MAAERIVAAVRAAGYRYVALDLQGFRTGSLNEALLKPRECSPANNSDAMALFQRFYGRATVWAARFGML